MSTRWLLGSSRVGDSATLDGHPTIDNRGRIEIGARFYLASLPVGSHLVTGPRASLTIGDDVAIGHGAAIASFERVEIGSGTRIAPFVVLMDTDFHVAGDCSERHETSPVTIGQNVRIASRVTILRGAHIGAGAFVAAGSVVSGDVPAGARVAGVPALVKAPAVVEGGPAHLDVPLVVMRTLGLPAVPALDRGPADIPEWDSLGALKLLLALEDAFGVSLAEDEMARVASVADLASMVTHALAHAV